MDKLKSLEELESLRTSLLAAEDPNRPVVRVCLGPGCLAIQAQAGKPVPPRNFPMHQKEFRSCKNLTGQC
jgi:hypothetical protein